MLWREFRTVSGGEAQDRLRFPRSHGYGPILLLRRWRKVGKNREPLQLKYTLHHFMGCRIGLFYYATQHTGGHVDFDYFRYEKGS